MCYLITWSENLCNQASRGPRPAVLLILSEGTAFRAEGPSHAGSLRWALLARLWIRKAVTAAERRGLGRRITWGHAGHQRASVSYFFFFSLLWVKWEVTRYFRGSKEHSVDTQWDAEEYGRESSWGREWSGVCLGAYEVWAASQTSHRRQQEAVGREIQRWAERSDLEAEIWSHHQITGA